MFLYNCSKPKLAYIEIFEHVSQIGFGEFAVVALDKFHALLARHVAALDQAARHARGSAEAKLDVHHVEIEVVDLVVYRVEALE